MIPKVRCPDYLNLARTSPCTLRLSGILTGRPCASHDTVVAAHLPVAGKGVGTKVSDLAIVFACWRCHDLIDGRINPDPKIAPANWREIMLQAMLTGMAESLTLGAIHEIVHFRNMTMGD